jgi:hypothetical protein
LQGDGHTDGHTHIYSRFRDKLSLLRSLVYFAHSLRVLACVLLDEAGKPPDYIKKRLRWLGDSFRMYLQDTLAIQHQHADALHEASREVMDLISALPMDVIALSTSMTNGTTDLDMNEYADEMD